jgi:positive regulator of sigma E activity
MLLGDYLIYLLPCVFFIILTLALQLAGFSDHIWEIFAVFLTFGASLITATYFVSQMFGTQN